MKAAVKRLDLVNALRKLDRIVSRNALTPSLNAVLIKATNGGLQLSGTDLDLYLTLRVNAEVKEAGEVLASCEIVKQVAALNAKTVELQDNDTRVDLIWNTGRASIVCLDSESFPVTPEVKGDWQALTVADLRRIEEVSFCCEKGHPLWSAICVGGGYAVATDTRRLAAVKVNAELPLLSARSYELLVDMVGDNDLRYTVSPSWVKFEWYGGVCWVRAVSGQFPIWQDVVPKDKAITVKCSWLDLRDALTVITPVAEDKGKGFVVANFSIKQDEIIVSGSSDIGSAEERIRCEASGELNITVNARYLQQALGYVMPQEIKLYGETKPVVMEHGDRMALVLPIKKRRG